MARQLSIISFTGKLGNIIGYERNGKYFLRSMPEAVRQTAATRRAAQRFGIASKKAALIRNAFYDELDISCDSGHVNRLNKVLIAAAGNHAAITGFRFNQYAGTDHFFTIAPKMFRNGTLHIPKQQLSQYKDITALDVKVIAMCIDFKTRRICNTQTVDLLIDPAIPFSGADIPLEMPDKGTLVVTLQVTCILQNGLSNSKQFQAADIITVMEPQIPVFYSKRTYPEQAISSSTVSNTDIPPHLLQSILQRE